MNLVKYCTVKLEKTNKKSAGKAQIIKKITSSLKAAAICGFLCTCQYVFWVARVKRALT